MSIDPKQGGKCWSCVHCEDIGTQDDNPSGTYYRKCTHGAYDYVDKCSFYCSSYKWDGKTPENPSTTSSSGSYSSSSSRSYSSSSKKTFLDELVDIKDTFLGFVIIAAIIGIIIAAIVFIPKLFVKDEKTPAEQPAVVSQEEKTAVVCNVNNALNMRDAASQESNIITTVPKGETVTIIEEGTDYHFVRYGEKEGYCAAECLEIQ